MTWLAVACKAPQRKVEDGSMKITKSQSRVLLAGTLLLAGMVLLFAIPRSTTSDDDEIGSDKAPTRLFVWAGDQARTAPDFLSVIDFDEDSPNYGKVITTTPLPEPGASGNEPHHVGLSADGRILATGGLLSVLKGQKEIFFFDVSDPNS